MKDEKTLFYAPPQAEVIEIYTEQCFATSPNPNGDIEDLTGEDGVWW